ncbi:MAG: ABC transporter permease [Actinobacteria bacterium]|nr:MAG: ABC transporter permease [Actinomycetota bacterium]
MEATLASIVAAAAPLILATMGETITERSGVINLSLEGSLRLSAMTGFVVAYFAGNALVGFAAAMVVGGVIAWVIAFGSIRLKLNQIAVGFVLTLLAIDLASFLGDSYVGVRGEKVPPWPIPGLSEIPFLGDVLFSHNLVVYASFVAVGAAWYFLFRTRRGLELQGIGERPAAAFSRGVPVNRLRYVYTVLGGAMVGIAGAAYSLDVKLGWRETLTLNLGWIALAIVIFGGWHPVRVAFGCYLFGALQVAAFELQDVIPGLAQVLPIAPFPLMILALVLVSTDWLQRLADRWPRLRGVLVTEPPGAIGTVFERE